MVKALKKDKVLIENLFLNTLLDIFSVKLQYMTSLRFRVGSARFANKPKQTQSANKPSIQNRSKNKPEILKDFVRLAFKEPYTAM